MHGINKKSTFIRVEYIQNYMEYDYKIELGRVQALRGELSFTLILPKEIAVRLGIGKRDFLKCSFDGQKLVVEKLGTLQT
jgi:hypothetical protein